MYQTNKQKEKRVKKKKKEKEKIWLVGACFKATN